MRRLWRFGIVVFVGLALGGCVGYITNGFEWRQRTTPTPLKTKPDVLARFGKPLRSVDAPDGETWYYRASQSLSGGSPAESPNLVLVILVPISWRSRPAENLKFRFNGDAVVSVAEMEPANERGFLCGIFLYHGDAWICGRFLPRG